MELGTSAGRVLAGAALSDVNLPPFEKSAMDGFAVHSADFQADQAPEGERTLPIVGESRAGVSLAGPLERGTCAAIYTGAELPLGADAVIMVERSTTVDGGSRVRLQDRPTPGQHVCPRGQDLAVGQRVLHAGRRLRPADLALLAAVGQDPVAVLRRPMVAIVTTGDELVPPSQIPGAAQIREGNTFQLEAACRASGAQVANLGIARDDPRYLERLFEEALAGSDTLVTTGGVSMGKYDLVGAALEAIGVKPVFHRVAIKPGKPLWFGVHGAKCVFALPGNPISCLVNFARFVGPALRRLGGERDYLDPVRLGRYEGLAISANPREQYVPVVREPGTDGIERLRPVKFHGSADVVGIALADALAVVARDTGLDSGALAPYLSL